MTTKSSNPLDELEVGDFVAWTSLRAELRQLQVERFTKTQVICGGVRFRRADGFRVGTRDCGGWDYDRIVPWTEKHSEHLASQRKARKLTNDVYLVRKIDRKLDIVPEEHRARAEELLHELASLLPNMLE